MPCVVVERDLSPPVSVDDVRALEEPVARRLSALGIHRVSAVLAVDGTKLTSVYATEDSASVQAAHEAEGVAGVSVWVAREFRD